jgi:hypothetical protein
MVFQRQQLTTHSIPQLARLQRAYVALFALIEDFPEQKRELPGACGDWSPRQTLAHFSGWLVEASERFQAIQAGDRTNRQYDRDGDHAGFNHASVKARAALSWDETVAELRQVFDQFVAVVQSIPEAALASDARYGEWLDTLWEDCVEHMAQLCRFILS